MTDSGEASTTAGMLVNDTVDHHIHQTAESQVDDECFDTPAIPPPAPSDDSTFVTDVSQVPLLETHDSSGPSPAEIDAAFAALIRQGSSPPPHLTEQVIGHVNRKKLEFLMAGDFRKAEKCESALALLQHTRDEDAFGFLQEVHQRRIESRQSFLDVQRAKIEAEYSAKIEQAREANDERYEELYVRHKNELADFQKKWQDPAFLKQFNRPSVRLVSFRQIERKMAVAGRFDEAKKTKVLADKMQEAEEQALEMRMLVLVKKDFAKLRERQKKEAARMVRHDERAFVEMEAQKHKDLQPLQAAQRRLKLTTLQEMRKPEFANRVAVAPPPRARSDLWRDRGKRVGDLRVAPPRAKTRRAPLPPFSS
jgi:hypothetical protein